MQSGLYLRLEGDGKHSVLTTEDTRDLAVLQSLTTDQFLDESKVGDVFYVDHNPQGPIIIRLNGAYTRFGSTRYGDVTITTG